jgi:mono/diheme cytochrome c family protein
MRRHLLALATLAATYVAAGAVLAQTQPAPGPRVDFGKREFEANCASCHGVDGKGRGPIVDLLRQSPPDLTQLAKKNGGILPMNRMYEVIDGTGVKAHGTRDMPVWGRDYRVKDAEYFGEYPYNAEALVRARIMALIEYIGRLQQK